jgi:hypothetical protein
VHDAIRNRLGWLDAPETAASQIGVLEAFAGDVRADGLTHACLLGMGGSSLCAEVLRDVPAARSAGLALTVLDTTDERAIREATEALDPRTPSRWRARAARRRCRRSSGISGRDDARDRQYRGPSLRRDHRPDTPFAALAAGATIAVFINAPTSVTLLRPVAVWPRAGGALGLDLSVLVEQLGRWPRRAGKTVPAIPPRARAFLAEHALAGRDKLTIVPDAWRTLGAWIEQLVAESTGKDGRGVLPVADEPLGAIQEYREDRAFVVVLTPEAKEERAFAELLERARRPVHRLTPAGTDLGAEFFRWEFATAVAGAAIGVNPFDEPNVRDAKVRTQGQLDTRRATGRFRLDPPFDRRAGYLRRVHRPEADPAQAAGSGPYLAILDYLPSDPGGSSPPPPRRTAETDHTVSTHGIGPRLPLDRPYTRADRQPVAVLLIAERDAGAGHRLHVQHAEAGAGARRLRRSSPPDATSCTTTLRIGRGRVGNAREPAPASLMRTVTLPVVTSLAPRAWSRRAAAGA